MNDELAGQLTDHWQIPAYAQDAFWVQGNGDAATACESARGLFILPAPAAVLMVRFGGAEGTPLARLCWQPDTLAWDGATRVDGYVDALPSLSLALARPGGDPHHEQLTWIGELLEAGDLHPAVDYVVWLLLPPGP